jgi:hypothetical protein
MLFRKSEKRKLPTFLGLTVGALAVVGLMSIKSRGKEIISSAGAKMKSALHKKSSECQVESFE